jgi:hypothetical protein
MRRLGLFLLLTMAIAALALGCGKKDEKAEKGAKPGTGDKDGKKGGDKPAGKATGIEKEAKSFTTDLGTIKVDVPKGWQEQKMSASSFIHHAPGSGLFKSAFWVSSTCQGSCSDIAKNLEERADLQVKSFGTTHTDYEVVTNEATADGWNIHVKMKNKGAPAHHYERYIYKEGWKEAASCTATLIGDEAKHFDTIKAMCDGMTVELKAK